ncbi:MAG: 2-succinyl-5-enolpyruvyl-6-hydroxy-3-cyclohexene-1-carboxylic-acid synthase [Solirubrobacterales bacterium]
MDTTNRNTALASALVDELARAGVGHACVSPGSRSAPLALALWREPAIRVWTHVDERCAGFFALGIAQQTGVPAVVLTTSGTAGANLHPAVAEASEGRVPLIVITADRPPELRGRGAGQTIDQLKLYGSAVRWFCELGVARADDPGLLHYRSAAVRAVAESRGRPPGPVHLNVPLTEPLAPDPVPAEVTASNPLAREGRTDGRPLTSVPPAASEPSDDLIAAFATLVSECTRGVILAGRQRDAELGATVAALARACGYPVLPEPTSQLRCGPHDRELVVPAYDLVFRDLPEALAPELVIRVGDMVTSKPVRTWLGEHPGCRQVVIDPDGAWNEPTVTADLIARADPVALLSVFAEQLAPRADRDWQQGWLAASAAAEAAVDSFFDALGDELFEPRIHRDLGALLPPGSTLFVASSMPIRDLETFLPSSGRELRFLANRGANGIDGMVSSGLGAAASSPGATYILTGDLGLYHDMNGLLTIRRLGVEATVIVLNNGGGGIFDFLPIARHRDGYEELFGTPTGLDLAKVADLYGIAFTHIGSYADLPAALSRPGLVEVPLDRARNVELHRELFERASVAAHAALGSR